MRTARGAWPQREGLLVRLEPETENGTGNGTEAGNKTGTRTPFFGECAPLPWFGTETVAESAAACAALGARVTDAQLDAISEKFSCLRFALLEGRPPCRPKNSPIANIAPDDTEVVPPEFLPVAALLPAGRAALEKIPALSESGFRAFKWKVGVIGAADPDDELALLDDILAALPANARLRLDANGAWTRRVAERWLARCAARPAIEFIEQPIAPAAASDSASTSASKNSDDSDDLLLGLAADYPTPLALDESVATAPALRRWLRLGWPGIFVLKPSLLGDAAEILPRLPPDRTVFSSALETAIGARAALRVAFQFYAAAKSIAGFQTCFSRAGTGLETRDTSPRALGFGVHPLFRDARFDAPPAAPFIRLADLDALTLKPEILWNALS